MNKLGQAEQVFIYALAIMIAGGILIFGYNAVKTFTQQGEDVTFVKFQELIKSDFKDIATDYGTVKIKTYEIGSNFREVCFIDEKAANQAGFANIAGLQKRPIILDAIQTPGTKNNLFLLPGEKQVALGAVNVDVQGITNDQAPNVFLCVKAESGTFKVKIEGTGRSTKVSVPT